MEFSLFQDTGLYWDEDVEDPQRIFNPIFSRTHRHIPADQLIVYDATKMVRQLQGMDPTTSQISVDEHSVIVSIDGVCRNNGTLLAQAAWSVYFGPQSTHNSNGILDPAFQQTSTRAEIEALSQALDVICNHISKDVSLKRYYIITQSSYLFLTFYMWIEDWIENGGKNNQGVDVAHFEILKNIHERLYDTAYGENGGMVFKFWWVSREQHKEADVLANEALDKESRAN